MLTNLSVAKTETQPEEMPCLVTASKNPELAKQTSTQTYTYTCIEHEDIVQLHWTWRHKISIPFMWQLFILLKGEEKSGNLPIPFLLTEFVIISLAMWDYSHPIQATLLAATTYRCGCIFWNVLNTTIHNPRFMNSSWGVCSRYNADVPCNPLEIIQCASTI